eukprot:6478222-Amphidinium_carterae.3
MPKQRVVLVEKANVEQAAVEKAFVKPAVGVPATPVMMNHTDLGNRRFHNPWFDSASYIGGTFKIPAPRVPGLAELVRTTVNPLAALLKVRVSLVSWRGQEDQVRVHYIATTQQQLPLVDATIDGFALLRQICEDVATQCPFLYIEFRLRAAGIDDIMNFWTPTGRTSQTATLAVLHGAIRHLFAGSDLLCPTATVLLPEAHHLIIFARPLTHHSMHDRYVDARNHLMAFLSRNPVRADAREWSFVADFVHGAGNVQRPCWSCIKDARLLESIKPTVDLLSNEYTGESCNEYTDESCNEYR